MSDQPREAVAGAGGASGAPAAGHAPARVERQKLTPEQQAWIVQWKGAPIRAARQLGYRPGDLAWDEVTSAGMYELCRSAQSFDPHRIAPETGRPVKFGTYCWLAVRRAAYKAAKRFQARADRHDPQPPLDVTDRRNHQADAERHAEVFGSLQAEVERVGGVDAETCQPSPEALTRLRMRLCERPAPARHPQAKGVAWTVEDEAELARHFAAGALEDEAGRERAARRFGIPVSRLERKITRMRHAGTLPAPPQPAPEPRRRRRMSELAKWITAVRQARDAAAQAVAAFATALGVPVPAMSTEADLRAAEAFREAAGLEPGAFGAGDERKAGVKWLGQLGQHLAAFPDLAGGALLDVSHSARNVSVDIPGFVGQAVIHDAQAVILAAGYPRVAVIPARLAKAVGIDEPAEGWPRHPSTDAPVAVLGPCIDRGCAWGYSARFAAIWSSRMALAQKEARDALAAERKRQQERVEQNERDRAAARLTPEQRRIEALEAEVAQMKTQQAQQEAVAPAGGNAA